jgi:two-component system, chemotaxis family, protein-glutamate methylesterase/glutaminase
MGYAAVVIGVSTDGVEALKVLLPALPASFPLPFAIVQHRDRRSDGFLAAYLNAMTRIAVSEAEDKEPFSAGHAYLAPAGYHLLIESDRSLSLTVDERVNYSCPSIDVLFKTAADVFAQSLIGIVLTGANADGAQGLKAIKARGGLTVVQDPQTAAAMAMPRDALEATPVDHVLPLERIASLLTQRSARNEVYGTAS